MKLQLFYKTALLMLFGMHYAVYGAHDLPLTQAYPTLQDQLNCGRQLRLQSIMQQLKDSPFPVVIVKIITAYDDDFTFSYLPVPTAGTSIFTTLSHRVFVLMSPTTLVSIRRQKSKPSRAQRNKLAYRQYNQYMADVRRSCIASFHSGHSLIGIFPKARVALQKTYFVPTCIYTLHSNNDLYISQIRAATPVIEDGTMYNALCVISLLFAQKSILRKDVFSPATLSPDLAQAQYLRYNILGLH